MFMFFGNRFKGLFILITLFFYSVNGGQQSIPLFKEYPALASKIDYADLGGLPTPVKKMKRLGKELGHEHLYVKNDGVIGNKQRKLAFLLGNAKKRGFKAVVSRGYAGSNHTCATSVYAKKLSLKCACVHIHQEPTAYAQRNLARSFRAGAEIQVFDTNKEMAAAFEEKKAQGYYPIVTGGSSVLGTLGFVNAAFELKQQIKWGKIPEPDYLFVGIATSGTAAGLALGLRLAGLKTQVVPVAIRPGIGDAALCRLFNSTLKLLQKADQNILCNELQSGEIRFNKEFAGEKYAVITPQAHAAISLLNDKEHIKLDGTYSGKVFAAFIDAAQRPEFKDKKLLFWNTFYAGTSGNALKKVDHKDLPEGYHRYFELSLQELDLGF